MLDCRRDRLDYGEQLRPPDGYRFDRAIAATYSADLGTLLSIPVALVYAQTLEGDLTGARFQLLEAIQQFSSRVRVFHQAGQLHVPAKLNWLYAHLEDALVPILPEDAFTAFHPKVWIIRFRPEEGEGKKSAGPNRFRVLVLSRNLTFDRSWDAAASFEGKVGKSAVRANRPLLDFVRWLDGHRPLEWIEEFLGELEKAKFETPHPFESHVFHPMGIPGYEGNPVEQWESKRTVVISPFLDATTIRKLSEDKGNELFLFSEPHELAKLPESLLAGIRPYHLSEIITEGESIEKAEEGGDDIQRQSLHAKLFIIRSGDETCWFLGSANATEAARTRNVEFLVEMSGTSPEIRIRRLLKELTGEKGEGPFISYTGSGDRRDPAEEQRRRERRQFEHALLRSEVSARVEPSENGKNFDLYLEMDLRQLPVVEGIRATIRPFNVKVGGDPVALAAGQQQSCVFANIGEVELSRFLQIRIEDEWEDSAREFLFRIDIANLPQDRLENILRRIIDTQDKFFDYLRFLLADEITKEDLLATGDVESPPDTSSDAEDGWRGDLPIYEQLLVVASREPRKLREIDEVIRHLSARVDDGSGAPEESRKPVIPEAFLSFWNAFRFLIPEKRNFAK